MESYRWTTGRTRTALLVILAMVVSVSTLVGPGQAAHAASTPLSTVTKSATDLTNNSTANSTGTVGTASPGDKIQWALSYSNNTTANAQVNITDGIQSGQTYVAGSLQTPANLTPQYSTNFRTASPPTWTSGTPSANATGVGAATTGGATFPGSASPTTTNLNSVVASMSTPGGDGWSIEGYQNRVYTIYHHQAVTLFCQTVVGVNCFGSGSAQTSMPGNYNTAFNNGTFMIGSKLYSPVESNAAVGLTYPVGFYCVDMTTNTPCSSGAFIQTGTVTAAVGNASTAAAEVATDGIAAADGNYYMVDLNGNLTCFNGTVCGSYPNMWGANVLWSGWVINLSTFGRYIFMAGSTNATNQTIFSCFDTQTKALCPGYPINVGPTVGTSPSGQNLIVPVLDGSGTTLGACVKYNYTLAMKCYSTTGTAIANPYPVLASGAQAIGGRSDTEGSIGQGVILGNKYYSWSARVGSTGGEVVCYQFAAGGTLTPCATFTSGPTASLNGYTVRSLTNVPGCLASDSDNGQILIFSETTGLPCNIATQSASLDPFFYCDGQAHTTTWGTATIPGLTGSEYTGGIYSVLDSTGAPVPGYDTVSFTGPLNVNLSAIPTTGATSKITVQVTLGNISNVAAVDAAAVQVTRTGDTYSQVCYQTTVDPIACVTTGTVVNDGNAVTVAGAQSDAPSGNSSGNVVFNVAPTPAQCGLTIKKTSSVTSAPPGTTVTYTVTVTDTGSLPYTAAAPASWTDDLTSVLSGATYNADASASAGTVGYVAPKLSWSGPLASGQTATITYSATVGQYTLGGSSLSNAVTSSSLSNCPSGSADPACAAVVTVASVPGMSIAKSADKTSVNAVGQTITYTFLVTNTGNVPLSGVTVADTQALAGEVLASGPSCLALASPAAVCTAASSTTLAPAQYATFTATYLVTQPDLDAGSVDDSATASGTPASGPLVTTTPSSASVTAVPGPAITVTKTPSPATVSAAGQVVTYTFVATNTGNVTLHGVAVTDAFTTGGAGTMTAISCAPSSVGTDPAGTLSPGASQTCTADYSVTQADLRNGRVANAATATGVIPYDKGSHQQGHRIVSPPSTVVVPALVPATPLAFTGVASWQLIRFALLLLLLGTALLLVGTRRRNARHRA